MTLTNPANNTLFIAGSNIALGASASDADGTVTTVQFFQGTNSLGVVTNAPYTLVWTNPASGTYSLTAVATDNSVLFNGTPTWSSAGLGCGYTDFYSPPNYFAGDIAEVLIFNRGLTDDERVTVNAYLNGKYGMVPVLPPTPSNLAASAVSPVQIGLSWSTPQTNGLLFSIERKTGADGVYAQIGTAQDTNSYVDSTVFPGTNYYYRVRSWNFNGWSGYSPEISPPSATITSPAPQSVFIVGTNITINATATDLDGTVTTVSFWVNDALAVSTTYAPYAGVLTNLSAGVYDVMAMATDNQGNSSFSATVTLIVSPDTDGDGISDYEEILMGTDPTNPNDPGPWTPPGSSTAPTIILTEPAGAVLLP